MSLHMQSFVGRTEALTEQPIAIRKIFGGEWQMFGLWQLWQPNKQQSHGINIAQPESKFGYFFGSKYSRIYYRRGFAVMTGPRIYYKMVWKLGHFSSSNECAERIRWKVEIKQMLPLPFTFYISSFCLFAKPTASSWLLWFVGCLAHSCQQK